MQMDSTVRPMRLRFVAALRDPTLVVAATPRAEADTPPS
jgi:hypothetical protein